MYHILSVCSFGKHNRAIGHQAGVLAPLLKKLCHRAKEISRFFEPRLREEARPNRLNQCQGPQEEIKFSPSLHSCILSNLALIS